jgi:hypothetical protein
MGLLMVTILMSCATQQERAERAAQRQLAIKEAVEKRLWCIDITSMHTMRIPSSSVEQRPCRIAVSLLATIKNNHFHCFIVYMLPWECLWIVERVRTQVLILGTDGLHILLGERERHDVQILLEVVGLGAGNCNQVALYSK